MNFHTQENPEEEAQTSAAGASAVQGEADNKNETPSAAGDAAAGEKTTAAAEPEEKQEAKREKSAAKEEISDKVLVVEDSLPLRRMLCKILESQKLQPFEAADGEAAMALIKQYNPEFFTLIMTDLMMPKMDGVEFIAALRKEYGKALPPIIICSSRSDRETVQAVAKLGAAGYILKPFKTEMVIQRVRNLLTAAGVEKPEEKKAEGKDKG